MKCCIARPVRPIVLTSEDIGKQSDFLEFDCECGSCCKRIALFSPRPSNIVLTDEWLVKIIADIRFGCKKSCFGGSVEVDFKNGVILDLIGDYVSIGYKVIEVINTGLEGAVIPPIALGGMVACCGAGAARGCATRTTERLTVESGLEDTILVPIPPFAYAVQFAPIPVDSDDFFSSTTFIQQVGSGGGGSILSLSDGAELPDPWTLINGARGLTITNTAATPIQLEVIFLIGV